MIFFLLLPHLVYIRECGFMYLKAVVLRNMQAILTYSMVQSPS